MLGYSSGLFTKKSHFGPVPTNFAMDNVNCTGDEMSIFDCAHDTADDCDSDEGAGVICSNDPGTLHCNAFLVCFGFFGTLLCYLYMYEKVSDVPGSRVWFASKNLTSRRMH